MEEVEISLTDVTLLPLLVSWRRLRSNCSRIMLAKVRLLTNVKFFSSFLLSSSDFFSFSLVPSVTPSEVVSPLTPVLNPTDSTMSPRRGVSIFIAFSPSLTLWSLSIISSRIFWAGVSTCTGIFGIVFFVFFFPRALALPVNSN